MTIKLWSNQQSASTVCTESALKSKYCPHSARPSPSSAKFATFRLDSTKWTYTWPRRKEKKLISCILQWSLIRLERRSVAVERKSWSTRGILQSAIKMTTEKLSQRKQPSTWARIVLTVLTAVNSSAAAARLLLITLVKLANSTNYIKRQWSVDFVVTLWRRVRNHKALPSWMFARMTIAKDWCSKAATRFLSATTPARVFAMKTRVCLVWTRTVS